MLTIKDWLNLAALALLGVAPLLGQNGPQPASTSGGQDLAQQAADPTAPLLAIKLKEEYVSSSYGLPDSSSDFIFQPVVPFKAFGHGNLLRATVTYNTSGPTGSGLASVSIFDLIIFSEHWGRWGIGPLVSFTPNQGPGHDTATAGPAIGFVAVKGKWNLGAFNQNLFGHQTRFSSFQPVISHSLGNGWTLAAGDAEFSIDWSRPQFLNVPLGIEIAKVLHAGKQPVRAFVNPEYNAYNAFGAPHWTLRFGFTILAPAK